MSPSAETQERLENYLSIKGYSLKCESWTPTVSFLTMDDESLTFEIGVSSTTDMNLIIIKRKDNPDLEPILRVFFKEGKFDKLWDQGNYKKKLDQEEINRTSDFIDHIKQFLKPDSVRFILED